MHLIDGTILGWFAILLVTIGRMKFAVIVGELAFG